MKNLHVKLSLITLLLFLFSSGLNAGNNTNYHFLNKTASDPIEIDYNDLPPFVKEFLYKGYEVKPEDVKKIIKIKSGAFLVKLKQPVNVFGINKELKMANIKLDRFNARTQRVNPRQPVKQRVLETNNTAKNRINKTISLPTGETAFMDIPLNIREYLIKRMAAKENQIYKVYNLGNDEYKIILKEAHHEFVIFEDSPNRIAFEHSVTDLLD